LTFFTGEAPIVPALQPLHIMKIALLLITVLAFTSLPLMAEDASFPKSNPIISMTVPEGWETEFEDDKLYLIAGDEDVVVEVSSLKATKAEGAKALEEMKNSVKETFKNVEFKPMQEGGANNLGLYLLNGTGEDEQGKAKLTAILVTNGDNEQLFMVFIAASDEGAQKFGEGIDGLLKSLKKI
jgi:hypothetical protein